MIITGLPIQGADTLSLFDTHDPTLQHFVTSSSVQRSYAATIRRWGITSGVPTIAEHIEFLWVLLCQNVLFCSAEKPAVEYLTLARTLARCRPCALATILLALVYHSLGRYVSDERYQKVRGALWFIPLWLFAYFLEISNQDLGYSRPLGLHVVRLVHTMPLIDLMTFFVSLRDRKFSSLYLKLDSMSLSYW